MISIIIPTFNRKSLLHDAVSELLDEVDRDFECVIVDDASTDGTPEAEEEWRNCFGADRIVYLRQEENGGAQLARNRGIEESNGDFILFMDSDDLPCPEGIQALRHHLESHPETAYCFGRVQRTDARLKPLGPGSMVGARFEDTPVEIAGYHWHTMGALYRRECVERVGPWNPNLTGSQDWEYQARVKLSGGKGEFVDVLVGFWRQHEGERIGASRFRPDYVRSVMLACQSILSNARECGRCDSNLEKRIAKKLAVHALEWGANGFLTERRECFDQAIGAMSSGGALAAGVRVWSMLPAVADAMIFEMLTKGQ